MREIVFHVRPGAGDLLEAAAEHPRLKITARSLEELHLEAREALINHFGSAHVAYRVRLQRSRSGVAIGGEGQRAKTPWLHRGNSNSTDRGTADRGA